MDVWKEFLKGFHGYLQTDGASYYNSVEDVTHVGCWAHLRRKFEDARNAMPKGKRSPTAEQGVAYCTNHRMLLVQVFLDSPRNEEMFE